MYVECQCGLHASACLKPQVNYCQQVWLHYNFTTQPGCSAGAAQYNQIKSTHDKWSSITNLTLTSVIWSPSLQAADAASSDSPSLSSMALRSGWMNTQIPPHTHISAPPSSAARKIGLLRCDVLLGCFLLLEWLDLCPSRWMFISRAFVSCRLLCKFVLAACLQP